MMKKIAVFILLLVCSMQVMATPIDKIIFFGDSLTDNGNLYSLFLRQLPKSPPYFNGRFSNGKIWSENVGDYYLQRDNINYSIYAVGGATVLVHMPTTKFISPSTLNLQVTHYILDSLFRDRSNVLFAIWMGGNDYLFDEKSNPTDVVNKMSSTIRTLIDRGAKHLLIMNLPDLSKIPRSQTEGTTDILRERTKSHNEKLAAAVKQLRQDYPDVNFYYMDIYDMFNDVMANPEKYNKKYNTQIKNITQACWTGGLTLQNRLQEETLRQDIQKTLLSQQGSVKNYDVQAMTEFVMKSPSVSTAYKVSKLYESGVAPCANPAEYLFWDEVHPTESVHRVLAELVVDLLESKKLTR